MKKTTTKIAPSQPLTSPTTVDLLRALIGREGLQSERLRVAERALPALVTDDTRDGIENAVLTYAPRLNFDLIGSDYYQGSTYLASLDGPNTAPGSTPQCIREWDTQMGFALGVALGLRIGGAR